MLGEVIVPMNFSPSIAEILLSAKLLWHSSVVQTLGQDFVRDPIRWIKQPNLIMKETGLQGISNLVLHPGYMSQEDSVNSMEVPKAFDPLPLGQLLRPL